MLRFASSVLILAVFLGSCASVPDGEATGVRRYLAPTMALPQELASDVDVIPLAHVRTRREPLRFAPYRVDTLRQGWVRERGRSLILGKFAQSSSEARQPFSFILEDAGSPVWTVDCEWSAGRRRAVWSDDDQEASLEKVPRTFLACELWNGEIDEPWSLWLFLEPAGGMLSTRVHSEGGLSGGGREFAVEAVLALAGTRLVGSRPSGYLFSDRGGAVAAMEITPPGRFIVSSDLGEADRALLAAASAALHLMDRAVFDD